MSRTGFLKIIFAIVGLVIFFILSLLIYLNWPGKYSVGTCLKSEKGNFIVKVNNLNRIKGVYLITTVKSNYSSGLYGLGTTSSSGIKEFEEDKDFTSTNCPAP